MSSKTRLALFVYGSCGSSTAMHLYTWHHGGSWAAGTSLVLLLLSALIYVWEEK
jgi:hypothetical protein